MIDINVEDKVDLKEVDLQKQAFQVKCPQCDEIHYYTLGFEDFECSCGHKDKLNWTVFHNQKQNKIEEFMRLQHQINKDIIESLAVLDVYSNRILESRDSFKQLLINVEKQGEIING